MIHEVTTTLRIDVGEFSLQRRLLTHIVDLVQKNLPYIPVPGDARLLNAILELTDALSDAADAEGQQRNPSTSSLFVARAVVL